MPVSLWRQSEIRHLTSLPFPTRSTILPFRRCSAPLTMPATGEEAHLSVDRVTGPGGQRWWSVALVRADGDRSALDGYPAIEWWPTRDKARQGYRARLRALREAGWQRVS